MAAAAAGPRGPKVGVVISNYNGWQDTLVCLDSLRAQTMQDFEVILLDDCSPNDSQQHLRQAVQDWPQAVFLPQTSNLGFAAVNNLGIRRALADGAEYVLLLNNDTRCAPDLLERLLQNTPAGAVSCPTMLFMDPPDELWFAGGTLDRRTLAVEHLGGHKKDGPAYSTAKQVSFITFCCVLLPRAVIEKVGFLDESLFMYCEDVDYCLRLTDAGVPLWYEPAAVLWHRAGGSGGGALSMYYITRNTLTLRCRGAGAPVRWARGLAVLLPGAVRTALTRLIGRPKGRSYGICMGALDFLRGVTGRTDPDTLKG